jgi:DNA-binding response OmpR family regulator
MRKILIIEDDLLVANIYRKRFAVEGFEVQVAVDGHLGLELARRFRPDAVILDLLLPRLSGVEVMKELRAEPDFARLPVVVFSNTYVTNLVQEAWRAGATRCLSKTHCTPKQVIDLIRNELVASGEAAPAGLPLAAEARATEPSSPVAKDPDKTDGEFQAELRRTFLESLPAREAALRGLLQATMRADKELAQRQQLHSMYGRIHALAGNAGAAGLAAIAEMADALEALLKELYETPKNITSSTLRTVASAIDLLGVLFRRDPIQPYGDGPAIKILVVDDEAISCRAVTHALEKARLKSVNVQDPVAAYKLLSENKYDLIFLDVDMPGMDGFELCAKLRALPAHKRTPVIFITRLDGLETRAKSMKSGGTDLITKPFLFIELAVKALVQVLGERMRTTA